MSTLASDVLPLGFACVWERPREATWSGTPMRLHDALARQMPVVDLGPTHHPLTRRALRLAHVRRRRGRWVSAWKQSPVWRTVSERTGRLRAARAGCAAVLEVQDLGVFDSPYYVWQDLSVAALIAASREIGSLPGGFEAESMQSVEGRLARQRRIYAGATGLLPMSRWLADQLVADGLPEKKIHVLHPGANIVADDRWPELPTDAEGREPGRFIFVGRDFLRKGGDLVVEAFTALRTRRPGVELTVIGPKAWPLPGSPPAGVRFLGSQPAAVVLEEMLMHDAFVMPSRFEAFGIAPAEALCAGLVPVVRDAFAMPEVIAGTQGLMVGSFDVEELTEALDAALDPARRAAVRSAAATARDYWSWNRAAADVRAVLVADGLVVA